MLEELFCALSGKTSPQLQQDLAALQAASRLSHFLPPTALQQTWQAMTALPMERLREQTLQFTGGLTFPFTSQIARALHFLLDFATPSL